MVEKAPVFPFSPGSPGSFWAYPFPCCCPRQGGLLLHARVWPPTPARYRHKLALRRNPTVCAGDRRDRYPHHGRYCYVYPGKVPQEIPLVTAGEKDLTNRENLTLSFVRSRARELPAFSFLHFSLPYGRTPLRLSTYAPPDVMAQRSADDGKSTLFLFTGIAILFLAGIVSTLWRKSRRRSSRR